MAGFEPKQKRGPKAKACGKCGSSMRGGACAGCGHGGMKPKPTGKAY